MEAINYKNLKPTRDYLQDIARIIGKAQQVYLAADPNYWQAGLEVIPEGLSSQVLPGNARLVLDMKTCTVRAREVSCALSEHTSGQVLDLVDSWLKSKGAKTAVQHPELMAGARKPEPEQARVLAVMFNCANQALARLKHAIPGKVVSPILVYPHHFDIALSWYPDRRKADETAEEHQYTYGLSTGDDNIAEPYFYASSYPDADEIKDSVLPGPAYWYSQGFTGAVFKYNDALKADPLSSAVSFFEAVLKVQTK